VAAEGARAIEMNLCVLRVARAVEMGAPTGGVPESEEVEEPSIDCNYSYHGHGPPHCSYSIDCSCSYGGGDASYSLLLCV
jgi:hypothetical protein